MSASRDNFYGSSGTNSLQYIHEFHYQTISFKFVQCSKLYQTSTFHFFQLSLLLHKWFDPIAQCNTKGAKCKRRRRKEKKKIDHQHVANISRPIFDRRTTNQKHHHQTACARGEGNYNGLKIFLKSQFSNLIFYSSTICIAFRIMIFYQVWLQNHITFLCTFIRTLPPLLGTENLLRLPFSSNRAYGTWKKTSNVYLHLIFWWYSFGQCTKRN